MFCFVLSPFSFVSLCHSLDTILYIDSLHYDYESEFLKLTSLLAVLLFSYQGSETLYYSSCLGQSKSTVEWLGLHGKATESRAGTTWPFGTGNIGHISLCPTG